MYDDEYDDGYGDSLEEDRRKLEAALKGALTIRQEYINALKCMERAARAHTLDIRSTVERNSYLDEADKKDLLGEIDCALEGKEVSYDDVTAISGKYLHLLRLLDKESEVEEKRAAIRLKIFSWVFYIGTSLWLLSGAINLYYFLRS